MSKDSRESASPKDRRMKTGKPMALNAILAVFLKFLKFIDILLPVRGQWLKDVVRNL